MQNDSDEYYTLRIKNMLMDYTRDLYKEFPNKGEDDITVAQAMEFVNEWVENHFNEDESDGKR